MSEEILQADNLCISYKNVKAVKNVSFTLHRGEVIAVIGSNGSGKTSAAECIEGLRKPDSGNIKVFGKDPWQHRSELYRELGVQLQESEYPLRIRVEELCRLFAAFYERPADWQLLLRQMGLDDKRKRYVTKLSGGERQRLSVILALMGRPKLLIMDEVTTGLDPQVRRNILTSFVNIKKSGTAMIVVSHYLDEAEALADKLLYLDRGEQRFFGTQNEFREYVKGIVPPEKWQEGLSLEKLYLMTAPADPGITMEGII